MEIIRVTKIDAKIVDAFALLIPQLAGNEHSIPSAEQLEVVVASSNTYLFVAMDNDKIVGSITLATYILPTGKRAWIEDVVVDTASRGRKVGEKLVLHVVDFARKMGYPKIYLTSQPMRVAANHLYSKLGFIKRDTNVYQMTL